MADALGAELRRKVENPLGFQWYPPVLGRSALNGFDATLLIDICNAIIAAEVTGALNIVLYENIVKQAHIIVGASAKSGITRLVYSLAGYNPSTEEVIAAFKLYVLQEAKKYEPEFPPELYFQWHRLYNIPVPVRGKPWHFKHLTVRHIYYPLARSNGKLLELLRALRSAEGDLTKKLFQFLNDIGARALRMQLGRVLEMAESSPSPIEYERKILERFGEQRELEFWDFLPPPPSRCRLPGDLCPTLRSKIFCPDSASLAAGLNRHIFLPILHGIHHLSGEDVADQLAKRIGSRRPGKSLDRHQRRQFCGLRCAGVGEAGLLIKPAEKRHRSLFGGEGLHNPFRPILCGGYNAVAASTRYDCVGFHPPSMARLGWRSTWDQ